MRKLIGRLIFISFFLTSMVLSDSAISPPAVARPTHQIAQVDGGWSYWYLTPCTKGCADAEGRGTRHRIRVCNNPTPQDGGAECRRHDDTFTTPDNRLEIDADTGLIYCENDHGITCSDAALNDATPPTQPQNLRDTVLSDSKIRLDWDHSTDNVEVVKYRIYDQRDFVIGTSEVSHYHPPGYQTNVYTVSLLAPATTYSFHITAVDEHGNESPHSLPITATTQSYAHDSDLISPFHDIVYRGAFKLPGRSGDLEYGLWGYGGYGLTYYPQGDPAGDNDGYPGSLFGRGHVYDLGVSEITIPQPVISPAKDFDDLNTATTLQPFTLVSTELYTLVIPTGGMAYLPRQGDQTSDKLYYTWGNHYQFYKIPSHSISELTLNDPQSQGWWYVGNADGHPPYNSTIYYLFDIPQAWANQYTGGRMLLTGGTRAGAQNGYGTAMFAIGPWLDGNPPPPDAELSYRTLLEYGQVIGVNTQDGRVISDRFNGGAWITQGSKTAVMLVGNKAVGEISYCGGYNESLNLPVFLFYDPADLAAVVTGNIAAHEPQPYAMLDVSEYFFNELPTTRGVAYDRAHGLIYVFEADGEHPLIHVFQITSAPTAPTLHSPQCVIGSDTLTATLTWAPLAETITSTLYYSNTYFTETTLNTTQILADSLPASITTYTVILPYNTGETSFFRLRSYLSTNTWSGLSNVVFCPHQDAYLPLIER